MIINDPLAKRQEMLPSHSWGALACQPMSRAQPGHDVSAMLCPFLCHLHSASPLTCLTLTSQEYRTSRDSFLFHVLAFSSQLLVSTLFLVSKKKEVTPLPGSLP